MLDGSLTSQSLSPCPRSPQLDKEVLLKTLAAQNVQRKRKLGDVGEAVALVNCCCLNMAEGLSFMLERCLT